MTASSPDSAVVAFFREPLQDEVVRLSQVRAEQFDALYEIAGERQLWAQHPESDRWKRPKFTRFFEAGLANALGCYTIAERDSGALLGMTRYYGFDAADNAVRIGFTFIARRCWGSALNGRVKALMLDHAFAQVARVYFDIGPENHRSQGAVRKLGAALVNDGRPDPASGNVAFVVDKAAYEARA